VQFDKFGVFCISDIENYHEFLLWLQQFKWSASIHGGGNWWDAAYHEDGQPAEKNQEKLKGDKYTYITFTLSNRKPNSILQPIHYQLSLPCLPITQLQADLEMPESVRRLTMSRKTC